MVNIDDIVARLSAGQLTAPQGLMNNYTPRSGLAMMARPQAVMTPQAVMAPVQPVMAPVQPVMAPQAVMTPVVQPQPQMSVSTAQIMAQLGAGSNFVSTILPDNERSLELKKQKLDEEKAAKKERDKFDKDNMAVLDKFTKSMAGGRIIEV